MNTINHLVLVAAVQAVHKHNDHVVLRVVEDAHQLVPRSYQVIAPTALYEPLQYMRLLYIEGRLSSQQVLKHRHRLVLSVHARYLGLPPQPTTFNRWSVLTTVTSLPVLKVVGNNTLVRATLQCDNGDDSEPYLITATGDLAHQLSHYPLGSHLFASGFVSLRGSLKNPKMSQLLLDAHCIGDPDCQMAQIVLGRRLPE